MQNLSGLTHESFSLAWVRPSVGPAALPSEARSGSKLFPLYGFTISTQEVCVIVTEQRGARGVTPVISMSTPLARTGHEAPLNCRRLGNQALGCSEH